MSHTIYGIPSDEEGQEQYDEQYDEKVLRRDSLVGNEKSFANVGGIDAVGGKILHTRKSVDATARQSVEVRRASKASQGGQGPHEHMAGVPSHLRGVNEDVLKDPQEKV